MATAKLKQTCPCGWRKKCFCGGNCKGKVEADVSLIMTVTGYGLVQTGHLYGTFYGEYEATRDQQSDGIFVQGNLSATKCVTNTSGILVYKQYWEDDIVFTCGDGEELYKSPPCYTITEKYVPSGLCNFGYCYRDSECSQTIRTGKVNQSVDLSFSYRINPEGQDYDFNFSSVYFGPEIVGTEFGPTSPQVGSLQVSIVDGPSKSRVLFIALAPPGGVTTTAGGSISMTLDREN